MKMYSAYLLTAFLFLANDSEAQKPKQQLIHQLRIYEIFKNNKQAFHDRFRDHAMRIMRSYGFNIVAIWESENENRTEFVYLLEWPNEKTMNESWTKFKADEEWKEIKKKTAEKYGDLVGSIQEKTLTLKDYSPNKTLTH